MEAYGQFITHEYGKKSKYGKKFKLATVANPKFKVGEKVVVFVPDDFGHEGTGFGIIKGRQYIWHPEHWGDETKPFWGYSIKNSKDAAKLGGEDVEGNWMESALEKFNPKDFKKLGKVI